MPVWPPFPDVLQDRSAAIAEAWRLTRYAIVGGTAALLYIAVALILRRALHASPQTASAFGVTAAATFAYLGHHTVTFRADGEHGHYFPRFVAVTLIVYVTSYLGIKLLVEGHLTAFPVATVLVGGAGACVSFLANRLLVFRRA